MAETERIAELEARLAALENDLKDTRKALGHAIRFSTDLYDLAFGIPSLYTAHPDSTDERQRLLEAIRKASSGFSENLRQATDLLWGPADE